MFSIIFILSITNAGLESQAASTKCFYLLPFHEIDYRHIIIYQSLLDYEGVHIEHILVHVTTWLDKEGS